MNFESNQPPSEKQPEKQHTSPVTRRSFLKTAGKLAIGFAALSRGGKDDAIEGAEEKDAATEALSEEAVEKALDELSAKYPETWEVVRDNALLRGITFMEQFYASEKRARTRTSRARTGAAVGVFGMDLFFKVLPLQEQKGQAKDDDLYRQAEMLYAHPVETIVRHMKAYASKHVVRSAVAFGSGEFTARVSDMLSGDTKDPTIREHAEEIAQQTLSRAHAGPPGFADMKKEMFAYVLERARLLQPLLEKKEKVKDPVQVWGAGSYYAAREIAEYRAREKEETRKNA